MLAIQIPVIILPVMAPFGTETELVADALTHVSLEPVAEDGGSILARLHEKTVFVFAQEIVVAGIPGGLQIWVEESPYPSIVSAAFWGAIGGGGGAFPPIAPNILAGTGVNLAIHTLPIHWNTHSPYIRVVVQTPVPAAAAAWAVQLIFCGKEG